MRVGSDRAIASSSNWERQHLGVGTLINVSSLGHGEGRSYDDGMSLTIFFLLDFNMIPLHAI